MLSTELSPVPIPIIVRPGASSSIDAAAHAALLALERGSGIYNIAEDDGAVAITRAQAQLGFDPTIRLET